MSTTTGYPTRPVDSHNTKFNGVNIYAPWSAGAALSSDFGNIRYISNEDAVHIATVHRPNELSQDEALFVASLMSHAPEMYEQLKAILAEVEGFEKRTGTPQFAGWIKDARALVERVGNGRR